MEYGLFVGIGTTGLILVPGIYQVSFRPFFRITELWQSDSSRKSLSPSTCFFG